MGSPMAVNLAKAGFDIKVWNRTPEKTQPAVEAGARRVDTVEEAAKGSSAVIFMLQDGAAVTDQLASSRLLKTCAPGTLIIDKFHLAHCRTGPRGNRQSRGIAIPRCSSFGRHHRRRRRLLARPDLPLRQESEDIAGSCVPCCFLRPPSTTSTGWCSALSAPNSRSSMAGATKTIPTSFPGSKSPTPSAW
jgi:hypothetical protein